MKRFIYICLFMVLGVIVATFIHAIIELPALALITNDFEKYANSFLWQNWRIIHGVAGGLLWILGLIGGYLGGVRWWQILYVEKRYGTPRL